MAVNENTMQPLAGLERPSPQDLLQSLDEHELSTYPMGDRAIRIPLPYGSIQAKVADTVVALAFTVKTLLEPG